MEIISIDIRVFDSLVRRVETLARKAEILDRKDRDMSLSDWLDNEDVCRILTAETVDCLVIQSDLVSLANTS